MKRMLIGLITLCMAAHLGGCGSRESQKIDTKRLAGAFSTAETNIKAAVDRAIAAVKATDYPLAMAELSKIATKEKLTTEQQQALATVLEQTRKIAASIPPKNVEALPMAVPK